MLRRLIVNADDLGASVGVNRGIADAHRRGIVTSASLLVDRPAATDAVALANENPRLSIGLHLEASTAPSPSDLAGANAELKRQLLRFRRLLGRDPTHLDSHHHIHREPCWREACETIAADLGVPLREASPVVYIGGFYAQWEWRVTNLHYVSAEFLEQILREEVTAAWTEIGCHPGYVDDEFRSVYLTEREAEVATLTDPRMRSLLAELGIKLCSYGDYATATG